MMTNGQYRKRIAEGERRKTGAPDPSKSFVLDLITAGYLTKGDADYTSESESKSDSEKHRSAKRKRLESKPIDEEIKGSPVKPKARVKPNRLGGVIYVPAKPKQSDPMFARTKDSDVVDLTTNWGLDPEECPAAKMVYSEPVSERYERMRLGNL